MHHYNFPPYSTGETGRFGFTGRREVGHGALAGRALAPVLPSQDEFPYTIRVVSDIVSSNGSTSMASVCGGTLSLMDAGVPISAPVAGIAMGLITGKDGNNAVLTDIQGAEDHTGDMDFKVAGTAEGVTALQMDIKVKGIDFKIMEQALEQARTARLKILDHLNEIIDQPREELSEFAPRMVTFKVPTDKIGAVIGPGGSVIRGMIEEFGVTIDVSDDGTVVIGSPDQINADKTKEQIDLLTREVEVGATYKGKAVRLMPFGAFVQILPGKDGLVHISELSDHRVPDVESVVKIGDELEVMVINIDHMGRVDLSARAVIEQAKGIEPQFGSPRDRRGGSDRDGGGRGGDFRGDRRSGGGRERRDGGGGGDFRRERRPGGDGDFRRERRGGGDGDFRRERRGGGDGDFRRERRGGDGDFRPQGDSHPRRRVGGSGGGYPRRDRSSDDR
jgi:polyribonucleotide nucleotidyltransferase